MALVPVALPTWTAWMAHLYLPGQGSQPCDLLTLSRPLGGLYRVCPG